MRKRRWTILLAAILLSGGLLWAFFCHEPIQEGRCTLRRKAVGDPGKNQLVSLAGQALEFTSSCPNDVRDLPNGFRRPRFSHITAGGESLPVGLDFSSEPRLCLDTNRDGLLSNERCFHAKTVQPYPREPYWRFGPISVTSSPQKDQAAGAFYVLYRVRNRNKVQGEFFYPGSLYPASHWYGRLRLDGRIYKVAVVDGDYDGQFRSIVSVPVDRGRRVPGCDVFAIDRNRDGKFECSLDTQSEVAPLSRLLLLNDRYYAVNITADGGKLELIPAEPEQGQLVVDAPDAKLQLRLWSDAADQYLSPAGTRWDLPAGKYQTLAAVLRLRDAAGNEWAFTTGELATFEIRPEQTTRLRAGPPFVVTSRVKQVNPEWVSINLAVVGCAGEEYQASFQRNGRRPPEPTFQIIDEKGAVLVADKFQYG